MACYTELDPQTRKRVNQAAIQCYEALTATFSKNRTGTYIDSPVWDFETQAIVEDVCRKNNVEPQHVWYAFDIVTPATEPPNFWAREQFNNGTHMICDAIRHMC